MEPKLSVKQQRFIDYYIQTGNASTLLIGTQNTKSEAVLL